MTEQEDVFARLRLSGGRFEDGMPVEALTELVAYRDLIVEVATQIFRQDNPTRQRLPAGFSDRFRLRLQSIEDGSVIPVLAREARPGTLMTPDDVFTKARDVVEAAVAAAATGRDLPSDFPRLALVQFNRLGQTLRENETIELRKGNSAHGPRYTRQVRKRLLLLGHRPHYQEEVQDIGWVTEMDAEGMTCKIRFRGISPTQVQAPLDELTFDRLKNAFEPNGAGPAVYLSATGVFDAEGTLRRLDSIHDVAPVPEDLALLDARLAQIEDLQPGWLDGEGRPPASAIVRLAYVTLAELLRLDVPRPRLYPTPDGGVQAEWTSGNLEVSITFEHDGNVLASAVDTRSGAPSGEFTDGDAGRLANFVLRGASE